VSITKILIPSVLVSATDGIKLLILPFQPNPEIHAQEIRVQLPGSLQAILQPQPFFP
jgi:hypothetical protein